MTCDEDKEFGIEELIHQAECDIATVEVAIEELIETKELQIAGLEWLKNARGK